MTAGGAVDRSVRLGSRDPHAGAALTCAERARLAALEVVIERGRQVFTEVGAALLTIRDERLYRETHGTFEDYVRAQWKFSRQRAHQLIDAAGVAQNLSTTVDVKHLNERQARVLAPLGPDEQRIVYRLAKGTAPDGKITATHLRSLAAVASEIIDLGAIDDGTGEHVAWDELAPRRKASLIESAVTEETFERYERQRAQIRGALTSSASVEWYTPAPIVEAARRVLVGIDLDPASCSQANKTIRAAEFFTLDDDGLTHDWPGRVFLNPPYAGRASAFVRHLIDQHARGVTTAAVAVVNETPTATAWFRPLFDWPICFAGRVAFVSPTGVAAHPINGTVIVYLGPEDGCRRFHEVFESFGPVVRRWTP